MTTPDQIPIPTDATARGRVELPTFDRWHLDSLIREWCAGPVFPKVAPHLIDGLVHAVRVRLDRADRAALASGASTGDGVPPGYRLVPVEPTEEMLVAMHRQIDWCRDNHDTDHLDCRHPDGGTSLREDLLDAWRDGLAASPRPAAQAIEIDRVEGVVKRILEGDVTAKSATLILAQRLDTEEADLDAALRRDDLMPGDIEGAFHRIRDALGTFAPAPTMAEVERLSGPTYHVCWTQDAVEQAERVLVSLVREADLRAMEATIASLREGREVPAGLVALSDAATLGDLTLPPMSMDLRIGKYTVAMTNPSGVGNGKADRAFLGEIWNYVRAQIAATRPAQAGETG